MKQSVKDRTKFQKSNNSMKKNKIIYAYVCIHSQTLRNYMTSPARDAFGF